MRATWPISEERGDWQTRLELPEENATNTGNLIAYGWGQRPLSVSSSTPMEPDFIGQRLGGIVKHPKIEMPNYGSLSKTDSGHGGQATPVRRASSTVSSHASTPSDATIHPSRSIKFKLKTPISEVPPPTPGSSRAPPGSMPPPMTSTPGQEQRGDASFSSQASSASHIRPTFIKLKLPSRPNSHTTPSPGPSRWATRY